MNVPSQPPTPSRNPRRAPSIPDKGTTCQLIPATATGVPGGVSDTPPQGKRPTGEGSVYGPALRFIQGRREPCRREALSGWGESGERADPRLGPEDGPRAACP